MTNTAPPAFTAPPAVLAVSAGPKHTFSKQPREAITLLSGLGVEGDAHMGETVKHRSRVAQNPDQPNIRQVHLIHGELFDELREQGFDLGPGDVGENILTRGLDLINLPKGTRLTFGGAAVIELTGLRNPCAQLHDFMPGLTKAMIAKGPDGEIIRKSGVMSVVIQGGAVRPGDAIEITLPDGPHAAMEPV